jgi:hypothetical protein
MVGALAALPPGVAVLVALEAVAEFSFRISQGVARRVVGNMSGIRREHVCFVLLECDCAVLE